MLYVYFMSVNRRNFSEFNLHKITCMFVCVCVCVCMLRIFIDISRLCRYFFPLVFNQCKCTIEFTINMTVYIVMIWNEQLYAYLKCSFVAHFLKIDSLVYFEIVGNCDNSISGTSANLLSHEDTILAKYF